MSRTEKRTDGQPSRLSKYSMQQTRISLRTDFDALYTRGVKKNYKNLQIRYLPGNDGQVRFAFVVSKKVGKAHHRNRIRRILRAEMHKHLDTLPASTILISYFPLKEEFHATQLHRSAVRLLQKAGLLPKTPETTDV